MRSSQALPADPPHTAMPYSRKFYRSQKFFKSCAEQQYLKLVREKERRRRWVGRRMISHTLGG